MRRPSNNSGEIANQARSSDSLSTPGYGPSIIGLDGWTHCSNVTGRRYRTCMSILVRYHSIDRNVTHCCLKHIPRNLYIPWMAVSYIGAKNQHSARRQFQVMVIIILDGHKWNTTPFRLSHPRFVCIIFTYVSAGLNMAFFRYEEWTW